MEENKCIRFSACEWIKGEYAIISWSMAEKIIRELDTEIPSARWKFIIVADSMEGLKNIKRINERDFLTQPMLILMA